MNRMGLVFLITLGARGGRSRSRKARAAAPAASPWKASRSATPAAFNLAGVGVILILIALYATWW